MGTGYLLVRSSWTFLRVVAFIFCPGGLSPFRSLGKVMRHDKHGGMGEDFG